MKVNHCYKTADGGYIATGITNNYGAGNYDVILL
jgi:hypothetical protein